MPVGPKVELILAVHPGDEAPVREALDATRAECTTVTVADPTELPDHLRESGFDLVLVALDLPDMDVPASLRSWTARYPAIPFVVLVPEGDEAEVKKALDAGARDYVLTSELKDGVAMARVLRHARERRRADSALAAVTARYEAVLGATSDGLIVVDAEGRIRDANPRAERMFGYDPGTLEGRCVDELVPAVARAEYATPRPTSTEPPGPQPLAAMRDLHGLRADGTRFPVELGLSAFTTNGATYVFASVRDITEDERLRRMAAAVEATDDVIVTVDLNGMIETWNEAAARRFGTSREQAVGRSLRSFLSPDAVEELSEVLRGVRAGEQGQVIENLDRDAEGRGLHLSLSFSPVRGRDGRPRSAVVIGQDITGQKLLEADLERLAYYDPLTGAANRRLLRERLDYAIALARRQGQSVGVVYLDLGGFKEINDRLGHAAGDSVLVEVAERLTRVARDSDLVVRQGGDEFVVLLSSVTGADGALDAGRRLLDVLEKPMSVKGERVSIDVQMGVALFPDHGTDAQELLDAADRAMYRRKVEARNGAASAATPAIAHGREYERAIRSALGDDRLRLHFQPIFRTGDHGLAGVEALLRWEHPERGLLEAAEFLPAAEELGLMPSLDRWALVEALRQVRESAPGDVPPFWLSVNLSSHTMRRPDTVDWIRAVTADEGMPPAGLRIEMRTGRDLERPALRRPLDALRAAGVGLTLDNFGVGENALIHLRDIPASCVKVDRSLIERIDADPEWQRFAEAAIEMGHAAGMQVAVEGVEREAQWERLRRKGSDFLQGYYLGRPAPGAEIWSVKPVLR